jgi:hypothetical protein
MESVKDVGVVTIYEEANGTAGPSQAEKIQSYFLCLTGTCGPISLLGNSHYINVFNGLHFPRKMSIETTIILLHMKLSQNAN